MKNCLVFQLKGSVDNESLLKLGYAKLVIKKGDNNTILESSINVIPVRTKSTDVIVTKGSAHLTGPSGTSHDYGKEYIVTNDGTLPDSRTVYYNGADGDNIQLGPKYNNNKIINITNAWLDGPLSQMFFDDANNPNPIEIFKLVGRSEVTSDNYQFEDIVNCPNLRVLYLRSLELYGSFNHIVNFPNIEEIRITRSHLTGSLDCLLNNGALVLPNLTSVDVSNSPDIEKKPTTVTTLQNLGVTVTV